MTDTLLQRLSDEADLCRNDGATDVAKLIDDAVYALVTQAAEIAALKAHSLAAMHDADACLKSAAELSALRADAERLDFLESRRLPAYTVWNVTRHWRTDGSNGMEERSEFEGWSVINQAAALPTIRDAIDAALRQEQAGGGEK